MMNKTIILDRIQNVIREVFNRSDITITRETRAGDIPEWDSLNHLVLIVAVEKEFNIKFGLGALQTLKNVGDLVDLIAEKLN